MLSFIKHHRSHPEQGNALIAVLMLAGISAGVAGRMSQMMTTSIQQVGHTRLENEMDGLVSMLQENVNCTSTLGYSGGAPTLCGPANANTWTNLTLIGRDESEIGSSSNTKTVTINGTSITGRALSNGWYIQASCRYLTTNPSDPNNGIRIRAAKYNSDGTVFVDRLTSKPMGFAQNTFLTSGDGLHRPALCREFFRTYGECGTDKLGFSINASNLNTAAGPLNCNQVVNANFELNAVQNVHVANANITAAKILNSSISGGKIANNSISSNFIGTSAVDSTALADPSVSLAKIGTGQVTSNKIAAGAVNTTLDVGASAIDSRAIEDGGIVGTRIIGGAVTTNIIGPEAVSAAKIANGVLAGNRLATASITNNKLAVGTLAAVDVRNGHIGSQHLSINSIVNAAINSSQVGNQHILDGQIQTRHIANGTITGNKIANASISLTKLDDGICQVGDTFKVVNGTWVCGKTMTVEFEKCAMGFVISRNPNPVAPGGNENDPAYIQALKDNISTKYTSLRPPYDNVANAVSNRNFATFMDPNVCVWKTGPTHGGDQIDWVRCNAANGWKLVTCQKGDNNGVNTDGIRHTIRTNNRIYFDKDVIPSNNGCETNDIYQAMGWMSVSRPENVGIQDNIIAICAKVK